MFDHADKYLTEHVIAFADAKQRSSEASREHADENARKGTKGKLKPVSRSTRAELNFSVGRVEKLARDNHLVRAQRISNTCAVYVSAVLEFVTNEIIKASHAAMESKDLKRMNSRHFLIGITGDTDLRCLVQNYNIINAGVVPTKPLLTKSPKRSPRSIHAGGGREESYANDDDDYGHDLDGGSEEDDRYENHDGDKDFEGGFAIGHSAQDEEFLSSTITKPGIVRLMRRAGVLRVSNSSYTPSLQIVNVTLDALLKTVTALALNKNLETVRVTEVEDAIDILSVIKQTDVFKRNLQGQCLSQMSDVKHRSPKRKEKGSANEDEDEAEHLGGSSDLVAPTKRKKHRSKPGVKVARSIAKLQESTQLLLQPTGFLRLVRTIGGDRPKPDKENNAQPFRYGASAIRLLQSIIENYLVGLFIEANKVAAHANRKTLTEKDLVLAHRQNDHRMCA